MPQPQNNPCPSLGREADICQPLRQGLPEANTTQERQDRQHCSGCITRTEIHPWAQQPSYLGAGTTPVCACPGLVASSGAGLAGSRNTQAAAVLHPLPKPFLCLPGCPCLCRALGSFFIEGIDRKVGAVAQVMSRSEGLILLCQLPRGEGDSAGVRSLAAPRAPCKDTSPPQWPPTAMTPHTWHCTLHRVKRDTLHT